MTSHRVSSCLSHVLVFSLLFSLFASVMMGQVNVQGRWSTLQTLMPINPIHVALLGNGKVLVVPGSLVSGKLPAVAIRLSLRPALWTIE